jgi:glutamine synthetase
MYAPTPEAIAAAATMPKLPLYLLDALRDFEADTALQASLGSEFSEAFLKLKYNQWNEYSTHLTQWERDTTLDC